MIDDMTLFVTEEPITKVECPRPRTTIPAPPEPKPSRGKRIANLLRTLANDSERMPEVDLDIVQAHINIIQSILGRIS